jgi:hypothetical protein
VAANKPGTFSLILRLYQGCGSSELFEHPVAFNLVAFRGGAMEEFLRDLRQGLRMFRQERLSFIATAVAALSIGIGANTAIFSLVNAVLLKEPPFTRADRIVEFQTKS